MKPRVYIDGQAGTTGLVILERLSRRDDLTVLSIAEERRKDAGARRDLIQSADVTILCLPDDASREAVALGESATTRWLDASSAHRVADGWVYGLPELAPAQRDAIRSASRVSNPGCYPTGVVLLLRPLVDAGLLSAEAPICVHALSGYSGGGRRKIERWESTSEGLVGLPFEAPYDLDAKHKHLPEMKIHAGLRELPHFVPAVGPFRQGMRVEISLHRDVLGRERAGDGLRRALDERYRGERFVRVAPAESAPMDELTLDPRRFNDTNLIELRVIENPVGHVLLIATLDNLGKGAAGAAVQNLNLMLGLDETTGLV
jgi:N-acetyl-gamma-glutamyl-phosphate reductase